jgi:uncharacterized protein (TIGR02118 family)
LAKVLVTYEQPKNQDQFEQHYFGVHIPLAQTLPNLKNASVHRVLQSQNTDANLYLIAELEFENAAVLSESLASETGQKVQKDVLNLLEFLHNPPVITIVD